MGATCTRPGVHHWPPLAEFSVRIMRRRPSRAPARSSWTSSRCRVSSAAWARAASRSVRRLVLGREFVDPGAEVGGAESVELLAEAAADGALESFDFFAQAPVVLLEQLHLQLPSARLPATGSGAVGCCASLTAPRSLYVLAHALGVDEPVRDVRCAVDAGEGDWLVVRDQLVDNGEHASALGA